MLPLHILSGLESDDISKQCLGGVVGQDAVGGQVKRKTCSVGVTGHQHLTVGCTTLRCGSNDAR